MDQHVGEDSAASTGVTTVRHEYTLNWGPILEQLACDLTGFDLPGGQGGDGLRG